MRFQTKVTAEMYAKLTLGLAYRKLWVIIILILGCFWIGLAAADLLGIVYNGKPWIFLGAGVFFVFYIPYSIYRNAKKNFLSNQKIQETIAYEFIDNQMLVKGETFEANYDLETLNRVEELKDWFLVYHSNQVGNLIPKSQLSPQEIIELRDIFKNLKQVKLKLAK